MFLFKHIFSINHCFLQRPRILFDMIAKVKDARLLKLINYYPESMNNPLQIQDAFYLTFGKENWAPLYKKTVSPQLNEPKTTQKPIETPPPNNYHLRPTRLSEHNRPKRLYDSEFYKQNIDYNRQTPRRSQLKSSSTDRQMQQSLDFLSTREQMAHKLANNKPHKSVRKYPNLFEPNPSNRLKDIETAATLKLERTKTTSEYRRPLFKNQPEIIYDKYRLINTQTVRKTKFVPANPTILKYKQDMNKIDSLISRINARISLSASKNFIEHKNYSFDKA